MRSRAPFAAAAPQGRSLRDRTLRRYLASFGLDSPPRVETDRSSERTALLEGLTMVSRIKPRPSLVHVVSPPPDERQQRAFGDAVRRVTRNGAALTWSMPAIEPALSPPWDDPNKPLPDAEEPILPSRKPSAWAEMAPIVAEAVRVRARAAQVRREGALRKLGVRVVRLKPITAAAPPEGDASPKTPE